MRNTIKKVLQWFFMNTVSYRLVHDQLVADSIGEVWESLQKKNFRPRHLVDVGASTGLWTREMVALFPDARCLMIDPLAENERALAAVSAAHANVTYWLGAVGSKAGQVKMFVHGPQSSVYASDWGGARRCVTMETLDTLVRERVGESVDALKLDVQGAEMEVLAGAGETLRACKVVQVEVSFRRIYEQAPLAHEIIRFFAERGFRIFDIASLYKRSDRALLQADMFFVSDDSLFEPETWTVKGPHNVK